LLYESPSSFRFYWVQSKLSETTIHTVTSKNRYRFIQVPYRTCDINGFRWAYPFPNSSSNSSSSSLTSTTSSSTLSRFGFIQDGILFYHAQTQYTQGSTPLTLAWKDKFCSPWHVSTPDGHTTMPQHFVCLSVHKDLTVRTLEGDIVGKLIDSFSKEAENDGDLFRFSISGIDTSTDPPKFAGLTYCGRSSRARTLPDSMSKIVFQVLTRKQEGLTPSSTTSTSTTLYRLLSAQMILNHIKETSNIEKKQTNTSFDLSAFSMCMDTESTNDIEFEHEEEKKKVSEKLKKRGKKKKQIYEQNGKSSFTPTLSYLKRFSSTATPMMAEDLDSTSSES